MPFFQMDDKFHSELKVMQAGTAAFGLYARCGDWVADHLMDGFVPNEVAANFGTREWIERLLASGLWLPADGGYTMPDYLGRHGNWSKEKVLAHRAAAAERQARARVRRTDRQDDDMSQGESRVTHNATHGVSHSSPSSSHPLSPSSSSSSLLLIRDARVVREEEEEKFLEWIKTTHKPKSPNWWRTVADNGDLAALADQWRATRTPATPIPPPISQVLAEQAGL